MISLHLTKTAQSDPKALESLRLPIAVGIETAAHIRRRAQRGEFATSPAPYKTTQTDRIGRKRPYRVSEAYAAAAGVGNQTLFESSADFHRAAGAVPGNVSGELWRSLTVRNYGSDGVILEFAGTSPSARVRTKLKTTASKDEWVVTTSKDGKVRARRRRVIARDDDGNAQRVAVAPRVTNRLKAATVFRRSRIGLLQPTSSEFAAQSSAVMETLALATSRCFGSEIPAMTLDGDPALRSAIRRRVQLR